MSEGAITSEFGFAFGSVGNAMFTAAGSFFCSAGAGAGEPVKVFDLVTLNPAAQPEIETAMNAGVMTRIKNLLVPMFSPEN